jgi:hypothetical protein
MNSRNNTAAACKAIPGRVASISSIAEECANETEFARRKTFATDTGKQFAEIENLKSLYRDATTTAESVFGSGSKQTYIDDINNRNKELKERKAKLAETIDRAKAAIERADRDFVDSKEQLPETMPNRTAHVIDDYTLLVLFIAYIFFALTILYWYVQQSGFSLKALLTGLGVGIVVSGVLFMLIWTYL